MKNRFRLYRRPRGGVFYAHDSETGKQESLGTNAEAKIAEAMGWSIRPMIDENDRSSIEELNATCEEALNEPPPEPDPHREGIDWIRTDNGDLHHPLQHRCYESAVQFRKDVEKLGP